MKTDSELRRDVERELEWDPSVDERPIGVTVLDGIVTLTGEVGSYPEKLRAERAVERVAGVRGIANELEVKRNWVRSDADIAKAAVRALKWNVMVPADKITVKVDKGWVTLTGEVRWDFQRRAAEKEVRNLAGVSGVTNRITIRPKAAPEDVKRKIEETFERNALVDAYRVQVQVEGSEVILRGNVRSWAERHEAEAAAWSAPGVTSVRNEITVSEATSMARQVHDAVAGER